MGSKRRDLGPSARRRDSDVLGRDEQPAEAAPAQPAPCQNPQREIDWLALYRDGDRAAFAPLVDAFQPRLVAFFFRLCWDRDRAEDLTQELFLKLLRNAGRYQAEGKLSTFVFRVATNLWIDHYRQVKPQPRFASLDQVLVTEEPTLKAQHRSETAEPLQSAIAMEERETLRSAIEKLTTPHRLVFELAVFQQLPYSDVAGVLHIPVGTVKSRMHNAMHALKDMLGGAAGGSGLGTSFPGASAPASAAPPAREACG